MPNGQFHQKNQKKRRYGVKIKNPLRLPVVAHIKSETGAIRGGAVNGKETSRTIGPGEEIFVATKGFCELDIGLVIIKYDEVGNTVSLGRADGQQVDHRNANGNPGKEIPKIPTRVTEEKKRKPAEDEEVEIRSLGDMLKDRAKEEVKV